MSVAPAAASPWPAGFVRIPDEDWTRQPLETLALTYDTVQEHGWYRNLDRTVGRLRATVAAGDVVLDYSGGTGILAARLLHELPDGGFGILIVDSSPKFLRVALEKLGGDERVAFRLIRYLKPESRLELVQEVVGRPMVERGVDAIVSTNAIHLYYDLEETLRSWRELLRPRAPVFVQSGNIGLTNLPPGAWIIDETVEAIHRAAVEILREDDAYASHRTKLDDREAMAAYDALRRKFFLPVRPLEHYVAALEAAGFRIVDVSRVPIEADVEQWYEFLSAYHEGVLGWVGGSARVEGTPPADADVRDRLRLIRASMDRVFGRAPSFQAVWTYIDGEAA